MDNSQSLWTTADVAHYLRISHSKFAYLRAMGKMVRPVARLGNSLLFHPAEIKSWVCAGAPPLVEWEAIKKRRGLVFDGENL